MPDALDVMFSKCMNKQLSLIVLISVTRDDINVENFLLFC